MSVNAYLVHKEEKIIDGKKYVHEDHEFLWNNWTEYEIWDILWTIAIDMTNDECNGTIEIFSDAWEDLKEDYTLQNSEHGKKVHEVFTKYPKVYKKIDKALEMSKSEYITIALY